MRVEPLVGLPDQLAVKPLFTAAGLIARDQQNCLPLGVECKPTLHSPSAAANRSSFMFAWLDPLSVSTRGRPSCGPNC